VIVSSLTITVGQMRDDEVIEHLSAVGKGEDAPPVPPLTAGLVILRRTIPRIAPPKLLE